MENKQMAAPKGDTSTADHTSTLAVGDMAPDFELRGHDGETFRLSALRGTKNAVLAFYPFAFTGT
jgi:peroxiredoxin